MDKQQIKKDLQDVSVRDDFIDILLDKDFSALEIQSCWGTLGHIGRMRNEEEGIGLDDSLDNSAENLYHGISSLLNAIETNQVPHFNGPSRKYKFLIMDIYKRFLEMLDNKKLDQSILDDLIPIVKEHIRGEDPAKTVH